MTLDLITDASAWFWDKFGKEIVDKAVGTAKMKWTTFKWQEAANIYRKRVTALYSSMRILGNPRPISLEGIFTDVYVLDKLTAFRRFDIEQLKKEMATTHDSGLVQAERKYALRIALGTHRLFIVGKPGAGKSTFLKYIALLAAAGKIDKIPVYVSLKELADTDLDLMAFLVKQFAICAFPDAKSFIEHILDTGRALLLFDGLDEVSQENDQRVRITNRLMEFANAYYKSQCFITCRIAATDFAFDQFTYVELADFSAKQIRTFVTKWFKNNELKAKSFLAEIAKPEQQGLLDLARTPLLLALLCLAFDETMSFPQRRAEIYEEAIVALLKKWDASRNIKRDTIYQGLSLGRKYQMFARIARDGFEKGEYFFPQQDLARQIEDYMHNLPNTEHDDFDGVDILKSIELQHGIFIEAAQTIYCFSHSTLQEFFTARCIVDNATDRSIEQLVVNHLADSRWREVFLLVASLLDNADSFFVLFKQAIDQIINRDQRLIDVLRWAGRKASVDYAAVGNLQFATAVALDIDLDRERARFSAEALARAEATVRTRDFVQALNRAVHRTKDLTLTPSAFFLRGSGELSENRMRALIVADASSLMLALARDLAFGGSLDLINGIRFGSLFEVVSSARLFCLTASQELNIPHLTNALQRLSVPDEDASLEAWQTFTLHLRRTMQGYRDIGYDWDLTVEQVECLRQYNRANILFMDCLKLAYVSDRASLQSSLLILPEIGE